MPFLTEPEPVRGAASVVAPGVRRIVAENPSFMTYHGTNTYLIEDADGITVLDPGPDDARHVAAILAAADGRVSRILLTHTHPDHVGAVPALRAATAAPTFGFHESADPNFTPDEKLREGDVVAGLLALHTPGHASDHLSFARADGFLFSGDHVMSWNSSIVSPPNGDMAAYFRNLERLLGRDDRFYLPGHGPALANPRDLVRELLGHRQEREAAIASAIAERPLGTAELVDRLYRHVNPWLKQAAERNVVAHLHKLRAEGLAAEAGDGRWRAA